jgi:predicted transposase/invertase (TIGR01784 family)
MDSAIKAANERQAYITQDDEARRAYWSRRKAEHDRISGLNYARDEGRRENTLEVAKNLMANGVSIEIIAQSTGLSPEEIARL